MGSDVAVPAAAGVTGALDRKADVSSMAAAATDEYFDMTGLP